MMWLISEDAKSGHMRNKINMTGDIVCNEEVLYIIHKNGEELRIIETIENKKEVWLDNILRHYRLITLVIIEENAR